MTLPSKTPQPTLSHPSSICNGSQLGRLQMSVPASRPLLPLLTIPYHRFLFGLLPYLGLITIARIALRIQKRMFWWDDFWALISLACFTVFVPGKQRFPNCPLRIFSDSPLKVCLSLPTVPLSRRKLGLLVIIWVSWYLFRSNLSPHSSHDRSRRIFLLHRLGCSSLHHLHRRAYCSMGFSEEGYVGRRRYHVLPMGPPHGSDVLGL
jgi:hypothetical protein